MKCDELKAETIVPQGSAITLQMYGKAEVYEAIAELKDKVQQKDFFWEGCAFAKRGFKNTIEVSEYVETMENLNDELRKENEDLKNELYAVKTDLAMSQRWRKCSEELPKDGETVLVLLGRTPKTRGFFLTSRYVAGGWTYGEDPQGCKPTHWFRIPKAPEAK